MRRNAPQCAAVSRNARRGSGQWPRDQVGCTRDQSENIFRYPKIFPDYSKNFSRPSSIHPRSTAGYPDFQKEFWLAYIENPGSPRYNSKNPDPILIFRNAFPTSSDLVPKNIFCPQPRIQSIRRASGKYFLISSHPSMSSDDPQCAPRIRTVASGSIQKYFPIFKNIFRLFKNIFRLFKKFLPTIIDPPMIHIKVPRFSK